MIGRTLSHYRIVEPLGAGGMGEVHRARDEKLGRDVAVKVLPAESLGDEAARQRFQKEAEALVRLSHPLDGLRLASRVQVPWMGLTPDDSPLVVADPGPARSLCPPVRGPVMAGRLHQALESVRRDRRCRLRLA